MTEEEQVTQVNFRVKKETKLIIDLLHVKAGITRSEMAEKAFALYFEGEMKPIVEFIRSDILPYVDKLRKSS